MIIISYIASSCTENDISNKGYDNYRLLSIVFIAEHRIGKPAGIGLNFLIKDDYDSNRVNQFCNEIIEKFIWDRSFLKILAFDFHNKSYYDTLCVLKKDDNIYVNIYFVKSFSDSISKAVINKSMYWDGEKFTNFQKPIKVRLDKNITK